MSLTLLCFQDDVDDSAGFVFLKTKVIFVRFLSLIINELNADTMQLLIEIKDALWSTWMLMKSFLIR
jgi:hypothetical protein